MLNRVCGVIILYNPDPSIIDNIDSYINQIDCLIVLDNSSSINDQLVNQIKYINNVKYVKNGSNYGIAKTLNIAADIAHTDGYKYLLTMDQDSKAPEGMVTALLEKIESDDEIGIVSPLHSNRYGTHLKNKEEVEQRNIVMTSGNLISLEAFEKAGKFCEDYFIDYVDIEYCFRLKGKGYKVFRLNNYILEHNEADLSSRELFGKTYFPHNHKPFRFYYKTRNLLYLRRQYGEMFPELMQIEYDSYFRTLVKIVLFEKQKIKKMVMVVKGFIDYLIGKKGRKF